MMIKAVLVFTFFWSVGQVGQSSTGGHQLISSNPTVEAEEGDDVILQCHLQPSIDLQSYKFDVKRHDLKGQSGSGSKDTVYVHGREEVNQVEQLDQYRNRTSVTSEDLSRGNLTLIISSVQLRDSGIYKMYVSKLKASCFIDLTVVKTEKEKRDNPSTTEPPRNVSTSNDRDAQKLDWKTVISIVVPVGVLVVLYFLDKHGKIQICKKKNREV